MAQLDFADDRNTEGLGPGKFRSRFNTSNYIIGNLTDRSGDFAAVGLNEFSNLNPGETG